MIKIKAYTLFDEWNLYEHNSWSDWLLYIIGRTTKHNLDKSKIKDYLYNDETGELYDTNNIKIGQFGQETEYPYIYIDNCSYIRLLKNYEYIIKNSSFAKKCYNKYLNIRILDI